MGGAGIGYVEYVVIMEEISRVDGAIGLSLAAHNSLCSNHIFQYGTEEQKAKYLPPLARGEKLGAWGLTEPASGSDASAMRTTRGPSMTRAGRSTVRRTSSPTAISADTCVVMAITDREMRSRGISAFIFERGTTGFRPDKKENKLGVRASETASVIFEDCHVPDERTSWANAAKAL